MELFFEIFLCAMAVFGLWCSLCLIAQSLLSSRNIGVAIEIFDETSAQHLSALLEEVGTDPLSCRRRSVTVLYSEELCMTRARPTAADQAVIKEAGARWCVVHFDEQDKRK